MSKIQHGGIEIGDVASAKSIGRTYLGIAAAYKIYFEVSDLYYLLRELPTRLRRKEG